MQRFERRVIEDPDRSLAFGEEKERARVVPRDFVDLRVVRTNERTKNGKIQKVNEMSPEHWAVAVVCPKLMTSAPHLHPYSCH